MNWPWRRRAAGWVPGEGVAWWERWAILRLLHHDRAFGGVILTLLLGGGLLLAASLEWVPGHRWPEGQAWRMSGADWIRSRWHDQRMGVAGQPSFRPDAAAWRHRVDWDPADPSALRGYLDSLTQAERIPLESLSNGLRCGHWLWRIEGTNRSDVARVFRLLLKAEADEFLDAGLNPWEAHLEGAERELWLQRLADRGSWAVVGRSMGSPRFGPWTHSTVEWAWKAGWGPPTGAGLARAQLEAEAAGGGPAAVEANRLLLQVQVARSDLDGAEEVLQRLVDSGQARLIDRVRLGQLQATLGRTGPLLGDLRKWPRPEAAWEVDPCLDLLLKVGETRQAIRVLKDATGRWEQPLWWDRWADLLWQTADWSGLRELGIHLRGDAGRRLGWESVGWRLEAVGLEGLGRGADASDAWKQADLAPPLSGEVAWAWAQRFSAWGQVRRVADWLRSAADTAQGTARYWQVRLALAQVDGDAEGRLDAVVRLRALDPLHLPLVADHAWALLALRKDPAEVLKLLEVAGIRTRVGGTVRIQEALAWVQLGELDIAEARLEALPLERLAGLERTMVCLGRFEVHARRGRVTEAIEVYREIEGRFLMPVQLRWLEKEYHRLVGLRRQPTEGSRVQAP